jgi:Zinc finger, C2H2 type
VLEDDLLPKNICATCFLKIESIDKFAFSATKNQECFLTWLQQSNQQAKPDSQSNVTQTTIETSTNSDFSFSNITIKKEFNQRQQIVFHPQKTRNARHVDHITLEQIINDQIIKNPKLPASTTITKIDEPKKQRVQSTGSTNSDGTNISIVSYNNLQIGQVIKDYDFLKLILRALRWEEYDRKASYHELIERLKRSHCRDILSNKNLLSDNDVVQLLRSYVNDSVISNFKTQQHTTPHQNISKIFLSQPVIASVVPSNVPENVKNISSSSESMEVSIDPEIYLGDDEPITIDDEETTSAMESKIESEKLEKSHDNGKYVCSSCPEMFTSVTELENHVTNHLILSQNIKNNNNNNNNNNDSNSNNHHHEKTKSAIQKTPKKKKSKEGRAKSKRRKIVIRINPTPTKRNVREKPKVSPFVCLICSKSLSSKRNLLLHIEMHKNKNGKFPCNGDGCKRIFIKLENLVKHKQEAHRELPSKRRKNQNEK